MAAGPLKIAHIVMATRSHLFATSRNICGDGIEVNMTKCTLGSLGAFTALGSSKRQELTAMTTDARTQLEPSTQYTIMIDRWSLLRSTVSCSSQDHDDQHRYQHRCRFEERATLLLAPLYVLHPGRASVWFFIGRGLGSILLWPICVHSIKVYANKTHRQQWPRRRSRSF